MYFADSKRFATHEQGLPGNLTGLEAPAHVLLLFFL